MLLVWSCFFVPSWHKVEKSKMLTKKAPHWMFWLYWLSGDFHRQQYNENKRGGKKSSTAFFHHLVQNEAHIISNGNSTYGYTGDCSNVVADCKASSTAALLLKSLKEWQSGLWQRFDCTNECSSCFWANHLCYLPAFMESTWNPPSGKTLQVKSVHSILQNPSSGDMFGLLHCDYLVSYWSFH